MMKQTDLDSLEELLDKYDVRDIADGLASICYEKAEHLRCNWQDSQMAKLWEQNAERLLACAQKFKF